MTREFAALLERAQDRAPDAGGERGRAVAAAVRTVELLVTDPLLRRLLEVDAELLLPYLTGEIGRFQRLARELLTAQLRAGQADGSVRAGDARLMAATCEQAARGLVLAGPSLGRVRRTAALAELGRMLDAYLRP
jgi:hypothetical protein